MKFLRLTARLYASDNYEFFIEKTSQGWLLTESGTPRNRFATLNEAKAWTRQFAAGETLAYSQTLWYDATVTA